MSNEFIKDKEYKKIVSLVPIPTIDLVISDGESFDKILLVKRLNEPLQGQWWVPGGRIFKEETTEESIYRILLSEIGLHYSDVFSPIFVGYHNGVFEDSRWGCPTHTISLIFFLKISSIEHIMEIIKLDKRQSSDFMFGPMPNNLIEGTFIRRENVHET